MLLIPLIVNYFGSRKLIGIAAGELLSTTRRKVVTALAIDLKQIHEAVAGLVATLPGRSRIRKTGQKV